MKYNFNLFISVFFISKVASVLSMFRIISILEGLSYLAILSVTLELLSREFVFQMGMTHGVLIMVYMMGSLMVAHKENWSLKLWLGVFLASLIPMAFVIVEWFLQKTVSNSATPEAG
jgi:integral membrane protein